MIVSVAKGPDGRPVRNWGAVPIAAVALPVADFVFRLGPPKPVIAPLITSLVVALTLMLVFRLGYRINPKTLNWLLKAFIVLFCVGAIAYIAIDAEYVVEHTSDGKTQRVVVGYALKQDLERQIKTEADAVLAERERERDPLQNVSSVSGPSPGQEPKNPARDADKAVPFKTEDQIRDERVAQLIGSTGDPMAPYTESSVAIVTYALLLFWVATFACGAASVGILIVASRLILRRGALKPRAV